MFSKSIIVLATVAVAQVAVAATPACLIQSINKFDHPANQKEICCKESSKLKEYLKADCDSDYSAALDAYKLACKQAGYEKCSSKDDSSSSSSAASKTEKSSKSTSAPYPVLYTTVYYDEDCTCSKTKTVSSSVVAGSTGFATGTAPVATGTSPASPGKPGSPGSPGASAPPTGSPIAPVATGTATAPSGAGFTGAATRNVGSVAAGLLAVAGVALAL